MDPNSVLKLVREQRRQINESKFLKPSDQTPPPSQSVDNMVQEYKPLALGQLTQHHQQQQQQQQMQYQHHLRQQYEAMNAAAGMMRQPPSPAASTMQRKMMEDMYSAAAAKNSAAEKSNLAAERMAAPPLSAFSSSKQPSSSSSYFSNHAEYTEAQQYQQRVLKSNMEMYQKMSELNAAAAANSMSSNSNQQHQQQQQQKLNAAYSLEFSKKTSSSSSSSSNGHFNKPPAFYDAAAANESAAAAAHRQQQQQQHVSSMMVDPRSKFYKKSNIPSADFFLNAAANGGGGGQQLTIPQAASNQQAVNGAAQQQQQQQSDALTRSASVKSVASDSGIGSSSPLSDCSDYGGNANGGQAAVKQQAGGYSNGGGGGPVINLHKMPPYAAKQPAVEAADPYKSFANKLKRPYIEDAAASNGHGHGHGHLSPKLTTINNGSIVVPKPLLAAAPPPPHHHQIATSSSSHHHPLRTKSNENSLEMQHQQQQQLQQQLNMMSHMNNAAAAAAAATQSHFGPGRKRKNQPNIYDDMILANANRVSQQKLQNASKNLHNNSSSSNNSPPSSSKNDHDSITSAAVAAAAAVLGYTTNSATGTPKQATSSMDHLIKPKPITPSIYSNASMAQAGGAVSGISSGGSPITKQINSASSFQLGKNAPSGLVPISQFQNKDLNNNIRLQQHSPSSKYYSTPACTDRYCTGCSGTAHPPAQSSSLMHHLNAASPVAYHADKMAAFKSAQANQQHYMSEYHHPIVPDGQHAIESCCSNGTCTQVHTPKAYPAHGGGSGKQHHMIPSPFPSGHQGRLPTPLSSYMASPGGSMAHSSSSSKHHHDSPKRHSISVDGMHGSSLKEQQHPYCDCAECNYLLAASAAASGQQQNSYIAVAAAAAAASMMNAVNGNNSSEQHHHHQRHAQSPYLTKHHHLPQPQTQPMPASIPSPQLSSKSPQLRSAPTESKQPMSRGAEFASARPSDMLASQQQQQHSAALGRHQAPSYPPPPASSAGHMLYNGHAHSTAIDQALLMQKMPCPCKDCYNDLRLKQQQQQAAASFHHQPPPSAMSPGSARPSSQGGGHLSLGSTASSSSMVVKPKPVSASSSSNLLESYLKDTSYGGGMLPSSSPKRSAPYSSSPLAMSSAISLSGGLGGLGVGGGQQHNNKTSLAKHMESFIDRAFKADKDMVNPYFDINGATGRVFAAQRMQSTQYGDLVKGSQGLPITKQKNSFFSVSSSSSTQERVVKAEAIERIVNENAMKRGSPNSCCDEQSLIVIDNDENDQVSSANVKRPVEDDDEKADEAESAGGLGPSSSAAEYYSRNNMNLLTQAKDTTVGNHHHHQHHQHQPTNHSLLNRSSNGNESPSPAPSPSSSPFSTLSSVSSSSVKRLRRSSGDSGNEQSSSIQRLELSKTTTPTPTLTNSSMITDENETAAAAEKNEESKDPSSSLVQSTTAAVTATDDSSVSLSKKTLPIVASRIQDWLDKLLESSRSKLVSANYSFEEIYEQLLKHSWSRLLLTYMIESGFQFFVTKDTASNSNQQSQQQQPEDGAGSNPESSSSPEVVKLSLPKEKEANQLQNMINKGHNLALKADEFDLLRQMILFKEGGEESKFSEACAQAQKRLQETVESNHGQQQFTKLLLFLPSLYNVKTEVIEALFCRHLNSGHSSGAAYLEKRARELMIQPTTPTSPKTPSNQQQPEETVSPAPPSPPATGQVAAESSMDDES